MDEKIVKKIVETAGEVIEKLGMHAEIEAELVEGDNDKNYLKIHIQGDELGLLIGFKGQGILALQQYLTIIMSLNLRQDKSKEGEKSEISDRVKTNILVDINDYKTKQEDQSKQTAMRAIDQVIESGQAVELPPMNPAKRRIVHLVVSEDDRVESESVGESEDRRVVIKPAN